MNSKRISGSELTQLVFLGILVALQVVLNRLAVGPTMVKVSLSFIGSALLGYFFNPFWAGVGGGVSDLLTYAIFGQEGGFFPGFTLSAILAPVIYSLFFREKKVKLWQIVAAVLLVTLIVNLGLNTLWLHLMYGMNFKAALSLRLVKELITPWLQMLILYFILNALGRVKIEKYFK